MFFLNLKEAQSGGAILTRCIVSTCGTSILTNFERRAGPGAGFKVNEMSNAKKKELSKEELEYIDGLLSNLLEEASQWDIGRAKLESAELNALLVYYDNRLDAAKGDTHYFVYSDTYVGKVCAEIETTWWKKHAPSGTVAKPIGGLNTANYWSFREAMCELAAWCHSEISPMRNPPHDSVVFNLTGGFKGVQGFMQALGMLYADEMFYLFQGADELMRIPRLPFDIDESARKEIEAHFDVYRRLSIGGVTVTPGEIADIPESMVFTDGTNGYALSAWGEIFWNKFKRSLYEKQFYDSPLPGISLTSSFCRDIKSFDKDNHAKYSINERMDDLAKYILSNRQNNPDRLSVHRYHTAGENEWECYAWSDGGAYRILFHFTEDNQITLDQLIPHADL
jgi:putative CRISPR-associated protein (TIGR02619 family)